MTLSTDRDAGDDLAGLPGVTCFVLGVEYERFRYHLRAGNKFAQLVHHANVRRLRRMLTRKGRWGRVATLADGMASITVEAREPA